MPSLGPSWKIFRLHYLLSVLVSYDGKVRVLIVEGVLVLILRKINFLIHQGEFGYLKLK